MFINCFIAARTFQYTARDASDMIVNTGDTVELDCRPLVGSPLPRMYDWSRNTVTVSTEPVYTIDRVDVSLEGVYECTLLLLTGGEIPFQVFQQRRRLVVRG